MNEEDIIDDEFMKNALAEINKRGDAEYDGLLGTIPDEFPKALAQEFETTRGCLISEYGEAAVRDFIESRKSITSPNLEYLKKLEPDSYADIDPPYVRAGFIPPKIIHKIDALIYIQEIVELGPKDGIDAYGGMDTYKRIAQSDAGSSPRLDDLGKFIRKHVEENSDISAKEVMRIIPMWDQYIEDCLKNRDSAFKWFNNKGIEIITAYKDINSRLSRIKKFLR